MNLLPSFRTAILAAVSGVSRTGVQLTSTPSGTQVARGPRLAYAWQAEPPEAGWAVAGYEHCWEGWNKPAGSDDIQYLAGIQTDGVRTGGAAAARPLDGGRPERHDREFHPEPARGTTPSCGPAQRPGGVTRRGAYEANHTMLVT